VTRDKKRPAVVPCKASRTWYSVSIPKVGKARACLCVCACFGDGLDETEETIHGESVVFRMTVTTVLHSRTIGSPGDTDTRTPRLKSKRASSPHRPRDVGDE